MHVYVCLDLCLLGLTTYRKSLLTLILHVFKEGSRIVHIVEDVNHEQSTSLMATARMETTHELTYSVSRAIEVTTWQSVDAICHWTVCHCRCPVT